MALTNIDTPNAFWGMTTHAGGLQDHTSHAPWPGGTLHLRHAGQGRLCAIERKSFGNRLRLTCGGGDARAIGRVCRLQQSTAAGRADRVCRAGPDGRVPLRTGRCRSREGRQVAGGGGLGSCGEEPERNGTPAGDQSLGGRPGRLLRRVARQHQWIAPSGDDDANPCRRRGWRRAVERKELLHQLHVFPRFDERRDRVLVTPYGLLAGVVGSEREFEIVFEQRQQIVQVAGSHAEVDRGIAQLLLDGTLGVAHDAIALVRSRE